MNPMSRLRIVHAMLAVLAVLAYATGEAGIIHAWLGYAVAFVILVRLMLVFSGAPQLGLARFYPAFDGLSLGRLTTHPAISRTLLLGIALSLVGVTATGVAMDGGRALGIGSTAGVEFRQGERGEHAVRDEGRRERGEDAFEELHEFFGNLMIVLVVLHVAYLLAFKRPIARFMLFLGKPSRPPAG